jgi:multiple sugar transport system ATP-binding protein
MASITFRSVDKQFEDGTVAVDHLDLQVDDGEFMVLVGPSGCGKTTSLRMVAGLEDPTAGDILIGDKVVNDLPSRSRDIAMVFQSYALYPHMTVLDNIAFGLRMQGMGKAERRRKAAQVAEILDISDLVSRRPKQLSGGQRQRVAMGRAIVRNPQAFLMDEPLSNLDAKLRVQMRAEISRIQRRVQTTTLYVTHDQIEAMTMGDRVAVMRRGVLQQVDTPKALYNTPSNLFVAGFIGSPAMNLVEATVERHDSDVKVRFGSQSLTLGASALAAKPGVLAYDGRTIALGIRPENLEDASIDPSAPAERRLKVTVDLVEALGSDVMVYAPLGAKAVLTDELREISADTEGVDEDETVPRRRTASLVARCSARSTIGEGDSVELAVDTDRLQLFDLDSGAAIT